MWYELDRLGCCMPLEELYWPTRVCSKGRGRGEMEHASMVFLQQLQVVKQRYTNRRMSVH